MKKYVLKLMLLGFILNSVGGCGLDPSNPNSQGEGTQKDQEYYSFDTSGYFPESKSIGEMHNIYVAEMEALHELGDGQTLSDLVKAVCISLEPTLGKEATTIDVSVIPTVFGFLRDEKIADPYVGGNFDFQGFVDLFKTEGGLPELDAGIISEFLSAAEYWDYSDYNGVLANVEEFSEKWNVSPNDGSAIGAMLDFFVHSLDYWSNISSIYNSPDKALSDGNEILGDTLTGMLFGFMFTPTVGGLVGAGWSYIYAVSSGYDGCGIDAPH